MAPRVILVSNRLPVTMASSDGRASFVPSSGGLATALRAWQRNRGGCWVGWPGGFEGLARSERAVARAALASEQLVPVDLSDREVAGFYETFSNGVIWPLFHYLLDRVPIGDHDWVTYEAVNRKFAEAAAAAYRPGDLIWVHDYQLMLVPGMLRQLLPQARIGFFLHIPFPSSEVFRILPWRAEILEGLLAADVIGFHTYGYVRHFSMSILHVLGVESDVDRVRRGGHEVRLMALPIGMDAPGFAAMAGRPDVQAEAAAIRRGAGGRRILLGVDRLDYTKGLPRRLLAFEGLLADPDWQDRVKLIQIAVPTRGRVESYRGFKQTVEELVGRINGEYGTVGALPVHYLHGTVSLPSLVALFLAADVMVVTPLRDGLNLVAKEFVASRTDDDGVLVLSEFTGAASELGEALIVNPYDVTGVTTALKHALDLPAAERRGRMRALRERVAANTVEHWAQAFVGALEAGPSTRPATTALTTAHGLYRRLAPLLAVPLSLALDFDGTLVPITPMPDLSVPDPGLLDLLGRLAARARTHLHIISGRTRADLDRWVGGVGATLWAEHGFWWRRPGGAWEAAAPVPDGWREKIVPILQHFTTATPGSWIEEKESSLAWHYRLADPVFGAHQAHELRMLFGDALSNQPMEVREGKKVLEVRLRGVHKGHAVQRILASPRESDALIACGDDVTDEDMFAAISAEPMCASVHIGAGPSGAAYWLRRPADLRAWLELVADGAGE